MEGLQQDLRYALRRLLQRPALTLVSIATLSLGIGAATAIFSVADAVILRPLRYADADRLVVVWQSDAARGQPFVELSYPAVRDWRQWKSVFQDVAALPSVNFSWVMSGGREPFAVVGTPVSWSFFPVLGVAPARGRVFGPEDDRQGAAPVLVVSDRFWRDRLAADPAVVGRTLILDRRPFTVIGVMPRGFEYPKGAEVWMPLLPSIGAAAENAGVQWMIAVARLRDGLPLSQARRDAAALAERYSREHSGAVGTSAVLTPLPEQVLGPARPTLIALLAGVGVVLLAACAAVAGMRLAGTADRSSELAVRLALGATPARLARGIVSESLLLAAAGGALGILAARLSIPLLVALSPGDVPRLATASIDVRACALAFAAMSLATVATSVAPALALRRRSLRGALADPARAVAPAGGRLPAALVVSEVALAVVLLVAALLLARSFAELHRVPLGFEPGRLLSVDAGLPEGRFDLAHERQYFGELVSRVQALPGVESAAGVTLRPLWGEVGMDSGFAVEGQSERDAAGNPLLNFETVTPGYFATLGIPLKRGRSFDERDRAGAPGVVVVNETLARRSWPGQDAIGKRVLVSMAPAQYKGAWLTVVGVVGDARYRELTSSRLDLYMSSLQSDHRMQHLMVRTSGDPASLAVPVRAIVRSLTPDLPTPNATTMSRVVSDAVAVPRFEAGVFAAFAAVVTCLAALGLYGLLACLVARRTREIGVRMSLGAQSLDIGWMVLRRGLGLAAAGAAIGTAASFGSARLLSSTWYGVGGTDGLTLALASALLLGVAVVACLVPLRRAIHVDPAMALRHE